MSSVKSDAEIAYRLMKLEKKRRKMADSGKVESNTPLGAMLEKASHGN